MTWSLRPTGPSTPAQRWSDADWILLRGRTIRELEAIAIHAAFIRHSGKRRAIMKELGLSKSTLLRRLDALGLSHDGE